MLNDPVQGLQLFKRSRTVGNRFVPFGAEAIYPEVFAAAGGTSGPTLFGVAETALPLLAAQLVAAMTVAAEEDAVFDVVSDPTSFADPSPETRP
jgi:hypothetical protein